MPIKDIEHVVVLMLENRSFDSMLGWLYEHDEPSLFLPQGTEPRYRGLQGLDLDQFVNTAMNGTLTAKPVRGVQAFTVPDVDPGESFQNVETQWFGASPPPAGAPITMKGVLEDFVSILNDRKLDDATIRKLAPTILQTFTPGQLPVLSQLARHYAVSDGWFASVPSQTNPNRSFLMCGTSNGMINNGDLEPADSPAREIEKVAGMAIGDDRVDAPTVFNALAEAEVDWAVFYQTGYLPKKISTLIDGLPYLEVILALSPIGAAADAVLIALRQYSDYMRGLSSGELESCYTWRLFPRIEKEIAGAADKFQKLDDFHRRARAGQLPAFSYIEPYWSISHTTNDNSALESLFSDLGNDYHPPSNLLVGEEFVKSVYASLIANRAAWEKTLLLITFDEFVGDLDHRIAELAPGVVRPPWGDGEPPYKNDAGFKFDRLGARVPTIVVSPWVQKGSVFRSPTETPFDHASLISTALKWIDREDLLPQFGERAQGAPTFEGALTLGAPRTDEADLPFLDKPRAVGDPVRFGESIHLKSADGGYITGFATNLLRAGGGSLIPQAVLDVAVDIGVAAQFATIGRGAPARLAFVTQAADPTPTIAHGAEVRLTARDPTLRGLNLLGKWTTSPDCYFADEYLDGDFAAQQHWIVQKTAAQDQPLRYGDTVWLVNAFNGERLTPDERWIVGEGWVNTDAAGQWWTVEPADPAT